MLGIRGGRHRLLCSWLCPFSLYTSQFDVERQRVPEPIMRDRISSDCTDTPGHYCLLCRESEESEESCPHNTPVPPENHHISAAL